MVYAKKKTINCKYVKIKYSKIRRAKLLIFLEKDKKSIEKQKQFSGASVSNSNESRI